MAQIIVERTHNLGREAAREKADELAARLAREFGVSCQWQGDVLAVKRSGADGRIEVYEDSVKVLLNLGLLLNKGASVAATSLRFRPAEEKAAIMAAVEENVWPLVAAGAVKPFVDRTFPLAEVAEAHAYFDSGEHTGKVLLTLG